MRLNFLEQLQDSQQERSCISLQNMVETLKDPDFIQKLKQCQYVYEQIELFPLVGYGITITKIKKNSETKIKVKQFSKVERIIDDSYLDLNKMSRKEGMANCILPLLSSQEGNTGLLNCDLFKRKISYLVHQKLDSYKEDTFCQLLQASVHHIIKTEGIQSWGQEIIFLIFETCKQVFIGTPLYCDSVVSQKFKNSKFQLLSLFCQFTMGTLTSEEIFENYIGPKVILQKYQKFDDDKIQGFFDKLKFEGLDKIYQNINQFIENYLRENNYFIIKLTQKKIIQGLLDYMIPKCHQWAFIEKLEYVQEELMELRKLKYFTISSMFTKLLNDLFEDYTDEKKIKYFESFCQHYEEDHEFSYQVFLMKHEKYTDIYDVYALYKENREKFQSYNSEQIEKYQSIAIRLILNKIPMDQIKSKNPESFLDFSSLKELEKIQNYLQIFQKIFQVENAQTIHNMIIEEIKNLTWLNYLSSITNFKETNSIKKLLENFLCHLKIWKPKQQQDVCAKNLIEYRHECQDQFIYLINNNYRIL
ncbi:unnamed protein product (macronuclear) [Paramecium tetraurelia]|uniref:Chromosome undetermined scaffold_1, whole genome shotgun sequence n=1 Tax=Paramecium tetraurelia TaxID=5888 RepID=Q6BFQ2_PARTE|nr:hypothetical protein [Paramecium tetraurelia strain d4-2]XP_001423140.1 uncharacterized protein GSPATT00000177001 [Paramecium tetraurelia]CAH03518.1 hypothetical protein PTMB.320 [Paramecium tetraurelia]CAK55742.1 unnamed protein product [Paramecium tetraurelia]|eukprot:XP_001423140.1 hypothetical protein (macronuclear) [Paramecium tetraurelia strain d4-2]